MKPFHTIAIPHKDILEGRLTMDVFAADLWEVVQGRAPEEYANADVFFNKTFITHGLTNLLNIAEKRLKGKGGDPVIQLQTPFGGGKTHSLISLYHKSKEWKAKPVTIVGTTLDPKDVTLWAEIERQLKGKVNKLRGETAPGRDKIREVIEPNLPVLILMDEVLEYFTKASGIKVGESTLAAQSLAFMQELTEAVKTLDRAIVVLTLPSSVIEHYGKESEKLFQQLQKVSGRIEKVYTPVRDEEIEKVINTRLFSSIDIGKARKIIDAFIDYAEKEKILPIGLEKSEYRERFLRSYPFQPEVIDVLYQRWGSFTTFQRTRGVLRLLSLIIYSLKSSNIPFIRLSDFALEVDEIKRELIKHIGPEFDGIIAMDITAKDSGAKRVDLNLGDAYRGLSLGTKVATTIFLYSHSGGVEKGAVLNELKRCCVNPTDPAFPSSVIVEVSEKLKNLLFYHRFQAEKYYFTNRPNINRIRLIKMENINTNELKEEEKRFLKECLGSRFDSYIWVQKTRDIPDTERLKLVVLPFNDKTICEKFMKEYGDRPRINTNTLLFLCPLESERPAFETTLREKIADELIEKDKTLNISEDDIKEIKTNLKNNEKRGKEHIRNLYRIILIPSKDNLKDHDIGISTYGSDRKIDDEVYENLRSAGDILEGLSPLIIKEKYLKVNDYVEVKKIYESSLKTRGEIRFTSKDILKESIKEGVSKGLFGFGELSYGKVVCRYFKEIPPVEVIEKEVLIKEELCKKEEVGKEPVSKISEEIGPEKGEIGVGISVTEISKETTYSDIHLELKVPKGKLSDIMRTLNYLQTRFKDIDITIDIAAKDGKLTKTEYEDRIKEGLRQANIEIELEEKT